MRVMEQVFTVSLPEFHRSRTVSGANYITRFGVLPDGNVWSSP
jgi:hypothetical protein